MLLILKYVFCYVIFLFETSFNICGCREIMVTQITTFEYCPYILIVTRIEKNIWSYCIFEQLSD